MARSSRSLSFALAAALLISAWMVANVPFLSSVAFLVLLGLRGDPIAVERCTYKDHHIDPEHSWIHHRLVQVNQTLTGRPTNVTIHFAVAGEKDKEAIVLGHGMAESWRAWKRVMEILKDDYHVLAFDAKGFGGSSQHFDLHVYPEHQDAGGNFSSSLVGDELVSALDKLGITEFNLVTVDLTSYNSMIWVQEWPGRVLRFVKGQSTVGVHEPGAVPQGFVFRALPKLLGWLFEQAPSAIPRIIFGKPHVPGLITLPGILKNRRNAYDIPDDLFFDILRDITPGSMRSWIAFWNAFEEPLIMELMRQKQAFARYPFPVLVLQGLLDPAQPVHFFDGSHTIDIVPNRSWADRTWADFFSGRSADVVFKTYPDKSAPKAADYFTNSSFVKVELWEDVGHFPHLEQPERTANVIAKFIKDTASFIGDRQLN